MSKQKITPKSVERTMESLKSRIHETLDLNPSLVAQNKSCKEMGELDLNPSLVAQNKSCKEMGELDLNPSLVAQNKSCKEMGELDLNASLVAQNKSCKEMGEKSGRTPNLEEIAPAATTARCKIVAA